MHGFLNQFYLYLFFLAEVFYRIQNYKQYPDTSRKSRFSAKHLIMIRESLKAFTTTFPFERMENTRGNDLWHSNNVKDETISVKLK